MPILYLKFNAAVIKMIALEKEETTFGRKEGNDIVIDNPAVSGFHGKIKKEGEAYFVEDLDSTNGTFINGRRIKKEELKNKDQVRVARHILEFISDQSSQEANPTIGGLDQAGDQQEPIETSMGEVEILRGADAHAIQMEVQDGGYQAPREKKPVTESLLNTNKLDLPPATIKIVSGAADSTTEIPLKDQVTYIGTSPQAMIKIKGFLAPHLAAAISKKPDGYFLNAIKVGYPKVNGKAILEQVLLESGSLIEVGGTNMVFYLLDDKKAAEKKKA